MGKEREKLISKTQKKSYVRKILSIFLASLTFATTIGFIFVFFLNICEKYFKTIIPTLAGNADRAGPKMHKRIIKQIVLTKICESVCFITAKYTSSILCASLSLRFKQKLFGLLLETDLDYHISKGGGKTTSYLLRAGDSFHRLIRLIEEKLIPTIIEIVLSSIQLRKQNAQSLPFFYITLVFSALATFAAVKVRVNYVKQKIEITDMTTGKLTETFDNFEATLLYCNQEKEKEKFYEMESLFSSINRKVDLMSSWILLIQKISFVVNIFILVYRQADGELEKEKRQSIAALLFNLAGIFSQLDTTAHFMTMLSSSVINLNVAVETEDQLVTLAEARKRRTHNLVVREGFVRLVDIAFETHSFFIRNLNLEIRPGTTAIVGPSGIGKTTLTKLLVGLREPECGHISIDDTDISTVFPESLLGQVGIVTQTVFLYNTSVMENILYGNPNATPEEAGEAARLACIHEKIMTLPEKYDTVIGNKGDFFSGGEKQRFGLARVFLKKPKILVMDEATSSLDEDTEDRVLKNLALFRMGSSFATTLIHITHSQKLAKRADRIVNIEDHMELIKKKDVSFTGLSSGKENSKNRKRNGV
ncbi:MAG: ABC transporter [Amphiamblys sp. WSBS2006]|nr:MAG: ABC transporter [Amphiamblys sp. WSBS2006]